MRLKYESELDNLAAEGVPCILDGFTEWDNRRCYRWVFADINDPRNFEPIYKDPKRMQRDRDLKRLTCNGWSLSLYTNKAEAKSRWKELVDKTPQLVKKFGTFISEGVIQKQHGLSDKEGRHTHFELFEYVEVDLVPCFDTPEKIIVDAGA